MTIKVSRSQAEDATAIIRIARNAPLLAKGEDLELARRVREQKCRVSSDRLVESHMRLVVKIAVKFNGYRLPLVDLISEGTIGLMQAVERFDPDMGYGLSTYARWWIRAAMGDYVLRNFSLVKHGTTATQKNMFFNLRREREKLAQDPNVQDIDGILAEKFGVNRSAIEQTTAALAGDASLNAPIGENGSSQWVDVLPGDGVDQEAALADRQELGQRAALLRGAMSKLKDRERVIIEERRLSDDPKTLDELARVFKVSRERIRQIEVDAMAKLTVALVGRKPMPVKKASPVIEAKPIRKLRNTELPQLREGVETSRRYPKGERPAPRANRFSRELEFA